MGELEQKIRDAVEDAVVGEPLRPGLAGRAQSVAMGVLVHRGVRGGKVRAWMEGTAVVVEVLLPRGPRRVERIVLHIGAI